MAEELEKTVETEKLPETIVIGNPAQEQVIISEKEIKKPSKKKVKRSLKPLSIKMTCSKCGATVYHTLVNGKYRCNVCGNLTNKHK